MVVAAEFLTPATAGSIITLISAVTAAVVTIINAIAAARGRTASKARSDVILEAARDTATKSDVEKVGALAAGVADHAAATEGKLDDIKIKTMEAVRNTNGRLDEVKNELVHARETIAVLTKILSARGTHVRDGDLDRRLTDSIDPR